MRIAIFMLPFNSRVSESTWVATQLRRAQLHPALGQLFVGNVTER